MTQVLEQLAAAGVDLLPIDMPGYFLLARDGFVCLVERTPEGSFGRPGSAGLLTGQGFAALVWRGSQPFFVAHGNERAATDAEVISLRAFSADVTSALASSAQDVGSERVL